MSNLDRLTSYGFYKIVSPQKDPINFKRDLRNGIEMSVSVGGVSYSEPRLADASFYSEVEVAFINSNGNFVPAPTKIQDFPSWDGAVYAYVNVDALFRYVQTLS